MRRYRYLLLVMLLLASSGLAAWALSGKDLFRITPPPAAAEDEKIPVADRRLLQELAAVYAQMNGQEWAIEGVVAMTDKAHPEESMAATDFTYRQQGKQLYYRLGQMEIINLEDCYIVMQHDAKKILLSPPKEVTQAPYLPLKTLLKMTEEEEYSVTKKVDGSIATISLARENHISCKEYAISFDTASLRIHRIRTRLTNLDFPADSTKERVMEVNISGWPAAGNRKYLNKRHYIHSEGNDYAPAAAFQDYQLIRL